MNVDEKLDPTLRGEARPGQNQGSKPRADHAPGLFQTSKRRQRLRRFFENGDQDRIRADLATFFGPDSEGYLSFYEHRRSNGGSWVWSWSWAFTSCPHSWHFYRKMYVWGACMILVMAASAIWNPLLAGLPFVFFAVTAKPAYINTALRRISKADELRLAGADRDTYLRTAGGTSILGGILSVLVIVALVHLESRAFEGIQKLF